MSETLPDGVKVMFFNVPIDGVQAIIALFSESVILALIEQDTSLSLLRIVPKVELAILLVIFNWTEKLVFISVYADRFDVSSGVVLMNKLCAVPLYSNPDDWLHDGVKVAFNNWKNDGVHNIVVPFSANETP